MKNLIYQTFITDKEEPEFVSLSRNAFKKYADECGADYLFSNKKWFDKYPTKSSEFFEKLRIFFDESFDRYDQVLYVDCDVLPYDKSSYIFDLNHSGIAMMPEKNTPSRNFVPPFVDFKSTHAKAIYNLCKAYGQNCGYFDDGQIRWYNNGVILTSREMRQHARKNFDPISTFKQPENKHMFIYCDEPYIKLMLEKNNIVVTELDECWNLTGAIKDSNVPDNAKFLHFSGKLKRAMRMYYEN